MDGTSIIPFEYKQIDTTGDYLYATSSDESVTVYNKNGDVSDIDENLKILNTENEKYKIYIKTENEKTIYSIYKDNEEITKNEYSYIQYLFDDYFIALDTNGKLGIIDEEENIKVEFVNSSIQKIDGTKLVETINSNTKATEIYSEQMDKVYELSDAKVEYIEEYYKLYNDEQTIYFSKDGQEINNIEEVLKKPISIGKYHQITYGNGEIYYTK